MSTPSALTTVDAPLEIQPAVLSSSPSRSPIRENLAALTGLRFWAAMLIVAFHTISAFKLDQKHVSASFGLPQGVTLFFVLSGFILTYNYANLRGLKEVAHFMFMRVARIWPTHAFCIVLALYLGLGVPDSPYTAPSTWANVFLLHSLIPLKKYFFALNFPSWSVSTEFVFYLLFPILLTFSRRNKLAPLLIASVFLTLGLGIAYHFYSPFEPEGIWFGVVYINPLTRLLEFALGIVAAQAFLRSQNRHSQTASTLTASALELGCVFAAMFSIFLLPTCVANLHLPPRFAVLNFYLNESSGAAIFAALIYALACGRVGVSKLLSVKWMVWLGEISFAVYMTHIFVLMVFEKANLLSAGLPRVGLYVEYLVVLIGIAAAVNYLVERPARKHAKLLSTLYWKSS